MRPGAGYITLFLVNLKAIMVERAESLHPAPKIIEVLGFIPPKSTYLAKVFAATFSAELITSRISRNPFRLRYYPGQEGWSVRSNISSVAERMGTLQKLIKKGESKRVLLFPSFEMERMSVEVDRSLGLVNDRDYELFMGVFSAFKDMGAMRIPELTLCFQTKPVNDYEKKLAEMVRETIEKRDERFIMFFDLDDKGTYKERLKHMGKWVEYILSDSDQSSNGKIN